MKENSSAPGVGAMRSKDATPRPGGRRAPVYLPSYARYGLAVVAPAAAMLLRHGLVTAFGDMPAFITFYPAVVLVGMFLGPRAGIVTTLVSALLVDWLLLPPAGLGIGTIADAVSLGLFTTTGLLVSWMASLLDRSRRREWQAAEQLDWLHGSFGIQSEPGKGTCATPIVPTTCTGDETDIPRPAAAMFGMDDLTAEVPASINRERKIRVFLADNHVVMRDGLGRLLEIFPDMNVVGKAADGLEAVEMSLRTQPDVVVMDVNLPGLDGVAATKKIVAQNPRVKIIGSSMLDEADVGESMKAAGAVRYLAKSSGPTALIAAIRECARKA